MDLRERRHPRDNRAAALVRHPWERARAAFFLDVITDHGIAPDTILDVGAGDAYLAERFRDGLLPARAGSPSRGSSSPPAPPSPPSLEGGVGRHRVTVVDAHYTDDDIAALAARGFDARRELGDDGAGFELVLLLDVAEHVDDPAALLAGVVARMRPRGHLLFSVPAIPALWSAHDVALDHRRRYRGREARALLVNAGLDIVESGGVFHSLALPRLVQVVRERLGLPGATDVAGWKAGETAARVTARALRAEQRIARALSRRGVDVEGLSWWALARRAR